MKLALAAMAWVLTVSTAEGQCLWPAYPTVVYVVTPVVIASPSTSSVSYTAGTSEPPLQHVNYHQVLAEVRRQSTFPHIVYNETSYICNSSTAKPGTVGQLRNPWPGR
jgi:hypothetical protein